MISYVNEGERIDNNREFTHVRGCGWDFLNRRWSQSFGNFADACDECALTGVNKLSVPVRFRDSSNVTINSAV